MTRKIMLTLADDTTDERCWSCPQIGEPRGHWCSVWGAMTIGRKRAIECLSAEREASKLVAIEPDDAAIATSNVDGFQGEEVGRAIDRVHRLLREHGKKAAQ